MRQLRYRVVTGARGFDPVGDDELARAEGPDNGTGHHREGRLCLGREQRHGPGDRRALRREGCKVVVAALPADKESIYIETVEAIRDAGGEAIGVAADLTVRDEVEQAVATATSALGPPDIAVCNVGGPPPGNFFDVTDEAFVKALDQMTMSTGVPLSRGPSSRTCASQVGSHREPQQRGGQGAAAAACPRPGQPVAGRRDRPQQDAVQRVRRRRDHGEHHRYGVHRNRPHAALHGERGDACRDTTQEKVLEHLTADVPARRVGKPEEMALRWCSWCSDGAGYINGELIAVDGGFHRAALRPDGPGRGSRAGDQSASVDRSPARRRVGSALIGRRASSISA